ncbi:peptidoglycan DD-metalloendopeptidase family protein [Corynebacterium lubricantis]|uniref:peptidoglycan DD-metalloendopeptidase family protein n=1 Tax=Corynebacterium lubricantis TaxID=541095 RepID=UPI000365A0CA|nr:peptidoglycan DD-metalloendopeptidase family protein [Corynebacterium lubricantis]
MKRGAYTLTSGFGPRWGAQHSGLDFGAPDGTPFYACAGGTVQYIGAATGYGQWIVIDHPSSEGGGCTEYGHMWNAFATGLKVGDWVNAGDLIGYVGSNGQSTGPHLHLTVWQTGYGSVRIDPEVWLQNALHPGEATTAAAKTAGSASTIFGVDVSEHQDGMSLTQAAREGIEFAIIRTTDGTYKDRTYRSHMADAENGGLVTAAYHYLRNPSEGTTIRQQVEASLAVMGDMVRPMWIDVETPRGLHVDHIREAKREFEARGVPVVGAYSYVPYWEGQIAPGEPDSHEFGAFWVAAYGANRAGKPSAIYPGDNAQQWSYPLGNQKPALWQFGSNAAVAGYSVDINAYKGTKEQIRNLFYGEEELSMSDKQEIIAAIREEGAKTRKYMADYTKGFNGPIGSDVKDIREQLFGKDSRDKGQINGWAQLGKDQYGNNLSAIDGIAASRQDNARIESKLDELLKKEND